MLELLIRLPYDAHPRLNQMSSRSERLDLIVRLVVTRQTDLVARVEPPTALVDFRAVRVSGIVVVAVVRAELHAIVVFHVLGAAVPVGGGKSIAFVLRGDDDLAVLGLEPLAGFQLCLEADAVLTVLREAVEVLVTDVEVAPRVAET
jgi:hypothetical protein